MFLRRLILYAGLTFSLSSLAFSLGSWTAQRSVAAQLAASDARVAALQENLARSILRTRESAVAVSGTVGAQQGDASRRPDPRRARSSTRSSGSSRARWACCQCACCASGARALSS